MINVPDRLLCISLIREAVQSGCRLEKACEELGLSLRTFQRWVRDDGAVRADGRTMIERPPPGNQLSEAERQQILEVANSAEFASLPPSQIVPRLADRGVYVASESSFYRVLRSASQQHHRGRARKPSTRVVTSHCATAPNQVWSWDITWVPAAVKGQYYYWYMMLDVFSRKIVGHEVHEAESAELAALLMRRSGTCPRRSRVSLMAAAWLPLQAPIFRPTIDPGATASSDCRNAVASCSRRRSTAASMPVMART